MKHTRHTGMTLMTEGRPSGLTRPQPHPRRISGCEGSTRAPAQRRSTRRLRIRAVQGRPFSIKRKMVAISCMVVLGLASQHVVPATVLVESPYDVLGFEWQWDNYNPDVERLVVTDVVAPELKSKIPIGAWVSKVDDTDCAGLTEEGVRQLLEQREDDHPLRITVCAEQAEFLKLGWTKIGKNVYPDDHREKWNTLLQVPLGRDARFEASAASEWVFKETHSIEEYYKINFKALGEPGTFGVAVEATARPDYQRHGKFAVKVISKSFYYDEKYKLSVDERVGATEEYLARLRNEVLMMMLATGHPNIIQFEEVFEDLSNLYIVMEYCSGGDVYSRCDGLTEDETKITSKGMLLALKYLQDINIVHLDLKPGNWLYTSEYSYDVRLIDFGFATIMDGECGEWFIGTPDYMAPEVARFYFDGPSMKYGKLVDNWSMGVTIYAMIYARLPFFKPDENEHAQVLRRVIQNRPVTFKMRDENVISYECRSVITGFLCRKPQQRLTVEDALNHAWFLGYDERVAVIPEKPLGVTFCHEDEDTLLIAYRVKECKNGYNNGLREGNIITEVNGKKISNSRKLLEEIRATVPPFRLTYKRPKSAEPASETTMDSASGASEIFMRLDDAPAPSQCRSEIARLEAGEASKGKPLNDVTVAVEGDGQGGHDI